MASQNVFGLPGGESPSMAAPAPAPYGSMSGNASSPGPREGIQSIVRGFTSQKVEVSDFQVSQGCAFPTLSIVSSRDGH